MITIYIIEDERAEFLAYSKKLKIAFAASPIRILPEDDRSITNDFLNWGKLKEGIIKNAAAGTLSEYLTRMYTTLSPESIDYYIIDNCLLPGDDDSTGISIVDFLSDKGIPKEKLLLFSNVPAITDNEELKQKCTPFSKGTDGIIELIGYISRSEKAPYLKPDEFKRDSFMFKSRQFFIWIISVLLQCITFSALVLGIWLTIASGKRNLYDSIIMNKHEKVIAYPPDSLDTKSITYTAQKDTGNLANEISATERREARASANPLNRSINEEKKVPMILLQFIEGIFLNFLPFFILFGFLGYYNNYLKYIWVSANSKHLPVKPSTQTLKFSKSLFISSVIATVIINILEHLVNPAKSKEESLLVVLIPHFIILLILCVYFFILEKQDNDKSEGDD